MAKSVSTDRSGIEFLGADCDVIEARRTSGIVFDVAFALTQRRRATRLLADHEGVVGLMPAARDVIRHLERCGWEFCKRSSRKPAAAAGD